MRTYTLVYHCLFFRVLSCFIQQIFRFDQVLGPGMNIHLTENFMIREIFALGAPIPAINTLASTRPSKQERVSPDIYFLLKIFYNLVF